MSAFRKLRGRLRWRVITQLNRLPGQCWAGLVSWGLGSKTAPRLPWSPVTDTCRRDAAENGGRCYCSKIRSTP